MTDAKKFAGFEHPKENWSKLPHALIDELNKITSESELKVILYILRHTWGYHDSEKRITIDEFCEGRKRSNGSRIDAGCGISANSVKAGIAKAVEHGYINVEEDASDKARIKRWYSISSKESESDSLRSSRGSKVDPLPSEVDPLPSEVDPRTEKDTLDRNLGKEVAPTIKKKPTQPSPAIPWQRQPSKKETNFLHLNARCPAAQRRPIVDSLIAVHGLQAVIDSDSPDVDRELNKMHELACVLHEMKMGVKDIERFAKLWQEKDFRGQKKQRPQNGQFLTFISQQLADTSGFPTEDPGERTTVTITDSWDA